MKDYSVSVEICHVLDSNGIKELSFLHVKHLQFYELKKTVRSCSSRSTGVVKLLISSTVHEANTK